MMRRQDSGFTLVEILVAGIVFALTATATVAILITAIRTVRENSHRVYAANLARAEIDRQRELGTTGIAIGNTTSTSTTSMGTFSISTTSNWVGLNQAAGSCATSTPGQAYMRVHVEVTGNSISSAEVSDTLVAPADDADLTTTGQLSVLVKDERSVPVPGVTVQVRDLATASATASYLTGPDGCVYIPQLAPSQSWQVTINRGGFVPRLTNGTTTTVGVVATQTTRVSFEYANASTLSFDSATSDFPIPGTLPLVSGLDALSALPYSGTTYPRTISSLWPATAGYTAWLGTCTDADPAAFAAPRTRAGQRSWYAVTPGQTTKGALAGVTVRVRGLPANALVRITHAKEATGACSTSALTYDVGRTDSTGVLHALLPFGKWTFATTAGPQTLDVVLEPPVTASASASPSASPSPSPSGIPNDPLGAQYTVNFTLAALDIPTASPTPTSTPTPTPSGSAS